MKKSIIIDIALFFFYGILLVAIILGCVDYLNKKNEVSYFTGKYAKYCYEKGTKNTNIKEKLYFDSLYECDKPLK